MTQFAVHRFSGKRGQAEFVVQIQSTRLEQMGGRLVMPLVSVKKTSPVDHALTPYLHVLGVTVFANPFGIAALPRARLGEILAILGEPDQDRIIRAIDELISRA